ncbi:MAG TPA: hypothetical protein HPQ03_02410 [Deltaproteobacteria bacterium]|nr:hypothetical protein [Deltaproteobacteria bacterium]
MRQQVKAWLEQGTVNILLGYKLGQGYPLPCCFTKENLDEAAELIAGRARYFLI